LSLFSLEAKYAPYIPKIKVIIVAKMAALIDKINGEKFIKTLLCLFH
jgi:hypothetical protein